MTSQSSRDNEPVMCLEKKPHFFKIVLEDSICNGKLMIPKKFVQKYGHDLPNDHILIEVPDGAVWQVELRRCEGEIWLQKGWPEFAEYYSLALGHLLVFEYKGNCDFHGLIFDKSGTEIEYPLSSRNSKKEAEYDGGYQKTREKSPLPSPRPHKVKRTNPINVIQSSGMEPENSKRNIKSYCSASKPEEAGLFSSKNCGRGMPKSMGQRSSQTWFVRTVKTLAGYEKDKALQRTSSFKSKNPFFKIVMQPSHVLPSLRLDVPGSFARKYFSKKFGDVILCVSDGRTWSAKYRHAKLKSGYASSGIYQGWKAFARDNYLEVGDVCVFELTNVTEMLFKVVIFHLTEDVNCQVSPEAADERRANEDEPNRNNAIPNSNSDCTHDNEEDISSPSAKFSTKKFQTPKIEESDDDSSVEILDDSSQCKFDQAALKKRSSGQITREYLCSRAPVSMNPFFKVVLSLYHFAHGNVSVPISFVRRYMMKENKIVTLQVADRSWPVKLLCYATNKSSACLSAGWLEFAKDNSLQVGDVCTFELIKIDVLKVSIFSNVS